MTEYSDGSKMLAPCQPCGLYASARSMANAAYALGEAADALAAVATTLKGRNQVLTSAANLAAARRR